MRYTYETLDGSMTFEISHPMADPALTEHPELKIPIRKQIGTFEFSKYSCQSRNTLRPQDYQDSRFNPANQRRKK